MRQIYGAEPDPNIYRTYYGEESNEEDSTPVVAVDRSKQRARLCPGKGHADHQGG